MYIFFDTETTGLPKVWKSNYFDTDNWPRLVQLAWIVTDENGTILKQRTSIIKPVNFIIPNNMIHRISHEKAMTFGNNLTAILYEFINDLIKCEKIIAHNFAFDNNIVSSEMVRLKLDIYKHLNNDAPTYCTMVNNEIVNFCRLEPFQYKSFKRPKLQELYFKVFGRSFDNEHDALSDVMATKECYFELRRRKIISF